MYDTLTHAKACLAEFRDRYNTRRPHWALVPDVRGYPITPEEIYVNSCPIKTPKWQGWAKGAKE
jgi:hypothetical protein